MAGFYLYCLRKKNSVSLRAVKTTLSVVKTIGSGEVYTLPFEELEAVVSEVSLKEFGSEKIQKKAQEDLNWIKEKAQIHEHVIEQAMGLPAQAGLGGKIIPVIPMKFGTIFKTKENLEDILSKNYSRFKKTLKELEGKQEWGVKLYLNEDIFETHLEKSETVLRKEREIASLPKGMDFFARKQIEGIIERAKIKKLKEVINKIFEDLRNFAVEANQGKNLAKEITGRKEQMVLSANFLIKEEKVKEFQKQVNNLKNKYKKLGLIVEKSGPWPPYNFVS